MSHSVPPRSDEIEVTLMGPGYGESLVLHIGLGEWLIVDSCVDRSGKPAALGYLKEIGVDAGRAVKMVVASHWHADHIGGMAQLVRVCQSATFCCAGALRSREFVAMANALRTTAVGTAGHDASEIWSVLSHLRERNSRPMWALARMNLLTRAGCKVTALSPGDDEFSEFVRSSGAHGAGSATGQAIGARLTPNRLSVVLWVQWEDVSVLLGADLEKRGWRAILQNDYQPPAGASVFKVPHHGSANAHIEEVWDQMLAAEPVAILAPYALGRNTLPKTDDVRRLRSFTPAVYSTAPPGSRSRAKLRGAAAKAVRRAGVSIHSARHDMGVIQLRRPMDDTAPWSVRLFGPALHLRDWAA